MCFEFLYNLHLELFSTQEEFDKMLQNISKSSCKVLAVFFFFLSILDTLKIFYTDIDYPHPLRTFMKIRPRKPSSVRVDGRTNLQA
jgi:hypothetical protein